MKRRNKVTSFIVQSALLAAVSTGFIFGSHFVLSKGMGSESPTTAVVTLIVAVACGITFTLATYVGVRVNLLGRSPGLPTSKAATLLESRLLRWSMAPMLFFLFLNLNFTGFIVLVFLCQPLVTKLMTYTPAWVDNVIQALFITLELVVFVTSFIVSFIAVRWIWKQQQEGTKSGAVPKGTDA
jgi:hypothetical protein